jgi:hypothetical protein
VLDVLVASLQLAATTHGSHLVLTFSNPSDRAVHMPIRVHGQGTSWDWLTVKLSKDGASTAMSFTGPRKDSATDYVDIAAGKSISEPIDLVPWAFGDGAPLAPGTYQLDATWAMTEPSTATLTASTTLTIAAPVDNSCTGTGTSDVALLVRQVPRTTLVEVGLHNSGAATVCVPSRVAAGEDQNDWLTIDVDKATIHFDDDRTKAGIVHTELAPGATVYVRYDLVAWATRKRNGVTLAHGSRWATATYDASSSHDTWRGTLKVGFPLVRP